MGLNTSSTSGEASGLSRSGTISHPFVSRSPKAPPACATSELACRQSKVKAVKVLPITLEQPVTRWSTVHSEVRCCSYCFWLLCTVNTGTFEACFARFEVFSSPDTRTTASGSASTSSSSRSHTWWSQPGPAKSSGSE